MFLDAAFDAIDAFNPAELGTAPFWRGHLPFAGFIVALQKPKVILELGVQNGDSLLAFANALKKYGPPGGKIIGVDAWEGDIHVGKQSSWIYERVRALTESHGERVSLRREYFEDAAKSIADNSVDLLHLDGTHTEEAARADLDLYLSKLSPRGLIIMHDIAVFRQDFGVWRVWLEAKANRPAFSFAHSCGLGVLGIGDTLDGGVKKFLHLEPGERARLRKVFSRLGLLAFHQHTAPGDHARVLPIGDIPPPREAMADEDFAGALATGRW